MKHTLKKSLFNLLTIGIMGNTGLAGNLTNYPEGFKPKATSSLSFTENKGQIHDQNNNARPDVLYSGADGPLVFHLKNNGISYQLFKSDIKENATTTLKDEAETLSTIYRLDINWLNANTKAIITTGNATQGVNNYYLAHCPQGALNVRSYENLTYQNLYAGIDLKWYQKDGHLKYDYLVAAGANYKQIQLELNGVTSTSLNSKGELVLKTPLGDIIEHAPLVTQNGKTLKAKWVITNNIASYEIQNVNPNEAFIIDPAVRTWGTYYGGSNYDEGDFCKTDANGNVYFTGYTFSASNIATVGSFQSTLIGTGYAGLQSPFFVKFSSNGTRQWSTYFSGTSSDRIQGFSIDALSNLYLSGTTGSIDLPTTTGCFQASNLGGGDNFLAKFNTSGLLQWSTYFGGKDGESDAFCSTDNTGNVYLVSTTSSTNMPIVGSAFQNALSTSGSGITNDGFIAKFTSSGNCIWSSYYGGLGNEIMTSCVADGNNNLYITGNTYSSNNIATVGSYQSLYSNLPGGYSDAFLVKFDATGNRLWGTYYRGLNYATCSRDSKNNVYLAGTTFTSINTSSVITIGSHQSVFGGGIQDGLLVKFNANGTRQWASYYGGTADEALTGCTIDQYDNLYICGRSNSTNAIATANSYQPNYTPPSTYINTSFLVKFDSSGVRSWGTYYGLGGEIGSSCTTDNFGHVYLLGTTSGTNSTGAIATQGGHQTANNGGQDAFLVQFYECQSPATPVASASLSPTICENNSATLLASGTGSMSWFTSPTGGSAIGFGGAFVTPTLAAGSYTFYVEASTCTTSATRGSIIITVNPKPTITVLSTNSTLCSGQSASLIASGATNYNWSTNAAGIAISVSPTVTTTYTVTGTNANGCSNFTTFVQTVSPNPTVTVNSGAICSGSSFTMVPSGANTYSFSSVNSVVTPTVNSTYTITGINSQGCSAKAISNVTVNPKPTITVASTTSLLCVGQSASLIASGATNYNWSTNAAGIAISVSPTVTTTYTVTGTNTNGCSNSTTFVQQVTICTGISNTLANNKAHGVSVYPNPTSNTVFIEINELNSSDDKTNIEIVNTLGELLFSETLSNITIKKIDMQNFANGIYFINVYNNSALIKTQKIIKE